MGTIHHERKSALCSFDDKIMPRVQHLKQCFKHFNCGLLVKLKVVLGALGNATGGSVVLNSGQALTALAIPAGVTAIGNFNSGQVLSMSGNLTNSGKLYALSTNPSVTEAIFTAQNIVNNAGALVSSVLPAGGLSGFAGAPGNLNLSLVAFNDIINRGTISSAGTLNLVAGHNLVNGSSAGSSTQAAMTAFASINMAAAGIVNSGVISSATGNINIASQVIRNSTLAALAQQPEIPHAAFAYFSIPRNLYLNNTKGVLDAALGQINIDYSQNGKENLLVLTGGDWLSRSVNINGGESRLDMSVENLNGQLNVTAGCAHADASTTALLLGNMNISGDPTYYNKTGSIL
jgi:hypothetical protein